MWTIGQMLGPLVLQLAVCLMWCRVHELSVTLWLHETRQCLDETLFCTVVWQQTGVYRLLVGKPEGKAAPETCRHRCYDIKMNIKEIGLKGMEWISLAQDRDKWQAVVCTVMNSWFPWNVGDLLTSWGTSSFPRSAVLWGVSCLFSCGRPFLSGLNIMGDWPSGGHMPVTMEASLCGLSSWQSSNWAGFFFFQVLFRLFPVITPPILILIHQFINDTIYL